jgi:hypothetical protein
MNTARVNMSELQYNIPITLTNFKSNGDRSDHDKAKRNACARAQKPVQRVEFLDIQ